MGVQVKRTDARGEHFLDLLAQLALDVDAAPGDGQHKSGNCGRIARRADQGEMNADVEIGQIARTVHRIVKRRAVRHQSGGGENTLAVRAHDAMVHVARETEIVGVNNQLLQNNDSLICRNFFGLARKSFISPCISWEVPFRLS